MRGDSEKLSVEALVDTSDTLADVRVTYVEKLRGLMSINAKEHAPPLVAFVWDRPVLTGVLENLCVTYVPFTPDGIPIRAKLTMSLREYRSAAIHAAQTPQQSPKVEKSFAVRRGDTLASISRRATKPVVLAGTGYRQQHHRPAPPAARAGPNRPRSTQ